MHDNSIPARDPMPTFDLEGALDSLKDTPLLHSWKTDNEGKYHLFAYGGTSPKVEPIAVLTRDEVEEIITIIRDRV